MSVSDGQTKPLLLATVGTDHHPFDRLVRWVDGWLQAGGGARVRCVMQTGTSIRPRHAQSSDYFPYDEMRRLLGEAAFVVCHGGPGTVTLASAAGVRPIVVPRTRALGEHVDDHQIVFSRRLARDGAATVVETEAELHAALERAADDPSLVSVSRGESSVAPAVRRFEDLVDELMSAASARGRDVAV